jgi:glycosyltransferase involved in cell wall biosynthesis
MTQEDVGVVVIGRNEGDRLVRCLASVTACARLVYVDSGSTDESVDNAARIGASVVQLDLTRPFTAARARNEGFSALKSLQPNLRFVQFIDGDCSLVPGWLDKARAFLEQRTDVAIVCGRRRERHPEASIYNEICDLEWNTPIGEAVECGGDALMRVQAFESVDGFQPRLIAGEEPELCVRLRKIGWTIWRLEADMTEHDASMTQFRQFWVRTVRNGYAFADVAWLHRNSRFGIWKRPTLSALLWGGLLPATIGLGAFLHPAALLGAAAYPVQICRLALKEQSTFRRPWTLALLGVLSKFAQFQGILRFLWRNWQRRAATLIEYK